MHDVPEALLVYWALRWRLYTVHLMGPAQPLQCLPKDARQDMEDAWVLAEILLEGKASVGCLPSADILELRVLTRYRNDLDAFSPVRLGKPGQIFGIGPEVTRIDPAATEATVGLHPGRWTPGSREESELPVRIQRKFEDWQDVLSVLLNREVL